MKETIKENRKELRSIKDNLKHISKLKPVIFQKEQYQTHMMKGERLEQQLKKITSLCSTTLQIKNVHLLQRFNKASESKAPGISKGTYRPLRSLI